jgi:hypothetical protein
MEADEEEAGGHFVEPVPAAYAQGYTLRKFERVW